ncbi:MAG: Flp pilus assembly protein CpaB [Parvularculaceae bacterium]|nr:Flp pilus assembly protein CpaB [Parvularculaceae bacterium]
MTRLAVLGVALLAGVGAFFMMMTGRQSTAVDVVQPVQEKTVRVLVADKDFQRGERLGAEATRWVDWPEKALSESYITEKSGGDPAELEKAVARTGIVKGEPLIEAKIVRTGASGLLAAVLDPGMRAVTMRITPETGVSGFILPGDRVDIYYSETGASKTQTELLFDNVRVLAINTIYAETPEAPTIEGSNATVELSPSDAEYFINTRSSRGQMSFALRSVFTPTEETSERRNQSVRVIRYGRS